MIICTKLRSNDSIVSLLEWHFECPPKSKVHWQPDHSAMETAKLWLNGIPIEFKQILKGFDLEFEQCSPEFVTRFDNFSGNGRNHDLLILAKNKKDGKVIISVESKVDESYGQTIGPYLKSISCKKDNGQNSNADQRIEELRKAIFPQLETNEFEFLRYQLLTAVAGTLAEAKIQGAKKAIFLVQTLKTSVLNEAKNRNNQRDLDYFIRAISNGEYPNIHDNDLFGSFKFTGNEFIPDDVELWIGKYSVVI